MDLAVHDVQKHHVVYGGGEFVIPGSTLKDELTQVLLLRR